MLRARRTAELAGYPHPEVTDLLREFDYGEYEGLTSAEIRASRPDWEIYRDGCPGGESPFDITTASEFRLDVATLSELATTDLGRELALWNSP
jgi:broad specificity phosphatase PhoE